MLEYYFLGKIIHPKWILLGITATKFYSNETVTKDMNTYKFQNTYTSNTCSWILGLVDFGNKR